MLPANECLQREFTGSKSGRHGSASQNQGPNAANGPARWTRAHEFLLAAVLPLGRGEFRSSCRFGRHRRSRRSPGRGSARTSRNNSGCDVAAGRASGSRARISSRIAVRPSRKTLPTYGCCRPRSMICSTPNRCRCCRWSADPGRGEAAARLDLAAGRHDQRLARAFAVVFLEPVPSQAPCKLLGPLDRGQVVPVERHRQFGGHQQIATQHVRPVDDGVQLAGPDRATGSRPWSGCRLA